MAIVISGPGIGLPPPQNLYPTNLFNAPPDAPTNLLTLSAGDTQVIPAGKNLVSAGAYSLVQWQDPVTGIWRGEAAQRGQQQTIQSDGFTRRIANLLGCPIAAVIAGGGTSFTQATATITSNLGGSTWTPVVGGSLTVSTINAPGASFTLPPIVYIPAPPNPGIQASGYATLSSGTVSGVTLTNVGGGYTSATITGVMLPNANDPQVNSATAGTVLFTLTNTGKITGALCTDNGAPLATLSALTLTAAGGSGSGATITPLLLQTVTGSSVVAGGAGWGTAALPAAVTSVGGVSPSVSAITNPAIELTGFRPRPLQASATTNAAGTITASVLTIYDSGLFVGTPTPAVSTPGTLPTTLASITFTMGSTIDTVVIQPA